MSRSGKQSALIGGVILLSGLALIYWTWPQPSGPPAQNPFIKSLRISPLAGEGSAEAGFDPEHIRVASNVGAMLRIDYEPVESPPTRWDELSVRPGGVWPIAIAFYPRQGLGGPKHLLRCEQFTRPQIRSQGKIVRDPVPGGRTIMIGGSELNSLRRRDLGFTPQHELETPKTFLEWLHARSVFIPPPVQQLSAGEYIYEVVCYPTAYWISKYRLEWGSPVTISRGLLTLGDH